MTGTSRLPASRLFATFVMVTGVANLLGGPVIVFIARSAAMAALASPPALWVLAGFLSFSGVALIWAAAAPAARAPIIFWEGVLRLWAAFTFLMMPDWVNSHLVVAGDGLIGLGYVVGIFATGIPIRTALLGEPVRSL